MKRTRQQEPCHCSVLSSAADVSGIDWMVRHGRSLALSVAVNVAPGRLCSPKYYNSVQEMILSNATADRVSPAPQWGSAGASACWEQFGKVCEQAPVIKTPKCLLNMLLLW